MSDVSAGEWWGKDREDALKADEIAEATGVRMWAASEIDASVNFQLPIPMAVIAIGRSKWQ